MIAVALISWRFLEAMAIPFGVIAITLGLVLMIPVPPAKADRDG